MSLPKKVKYSININPPKVGNEFLNYGKERIEELMRQTDIKTKYLPPSISIEDIDQSVFDFVSKHEMKLILDGRIVPVFYLDNDRWGEFSKTWKFMDNDKNVPTPYITVRRTEKKPGTRIGTKYRVPQPRLFTYINIPILDGNEKIYLLFKMPQPINVDLTYEVVLFTKYRVDVNSYDEQIFKVFASRQNYLFIKGSPMPLLLEDVTEANPIENIDGDRFFVSKYNLKVLGFIRDEKEYEIVKAIKKPRIGYVVE